MSDSENTQNSAEVSKPPKQAHPPFVPKMEIVERMKTLVQEKKEAEEARQRALHAPKVPFRHEEPRVGRNDPCPCGSGKKYKKCHMLIDEGK